MRPGQALQVPVCGGSGLDGAHFESFTERTPTTKPDILNRLQDTRKRGYALSRGELDRDVLGVAAPLRDKAGDVVAAISVAAVSVRQRFPARAGRTLLCHAGPLRSGAGDAARRPRRHGAVRIPRLARRSYCLTETALLPMQELAFGSAQVPPVSTSPWRAASPVQRQPAAAWSRLRRPARCGPPCRESIRVTRSGGERLRCGRSPDSRG
ncbi:IclR family transcriptional regulator domain-containing protein [Actinoplanes subtropicus]|uniref:IclR family transcriptional regulator domain-containing protein n=1 Tax=Actinoplanes subtropicus TaxID=543632 RepID=UPI001B809AF4